MSGNPWTDPIDDEEPEGVRNLGAMEEVMKRCRWVVTTVGDAYAKFIGVEDGVAKWGWLGPELTCTSCPMPHTIDRAENTVTVDVDGADRKQVVAGLCNAGSLMLYMTLRPDMGLEPKGEET